MSVIEGPPNRRGIIKCVSGAKSACHLRENAFHIGIIQRKHAYLSDFHHGEYVGGKRMGQNGSELTAMTWASCETVRLSSRKRCDLTVQVEHSDEQKRRKPVRQQRRKDHNGRMSWMWMVRYAVGWMWSVWGMAWGLECGLENCAVTSAGSSTESGQSCFVF